MSLIRSYSEFTMFAILSRWSCSLTLSASRNLSYQQGHLGLRRNSPIIDSLRLARSLRSPIRTSGPKSGLLQCSNSGNSRKRLVSTLSMRPTQKNSSKCGKLDGGAKVIGHCPVPSLRGGRDTERSTWFQVLMLAEISDMAEVLKGVYPKEVGTERV
jgi:hypothetical protein